MISNPASISPCVPRVDPDWPFSELRAQDQEGMENEILPDAYGEGGRFQSGLTSLVPFVATIAMGVGTNIPIL